MLLGPSSSFQVDMFCSVLFCTVYATVHCTVAYTYVTFYEVQKHDHVYLVGLYDKYFDVIVCSDLPDLRGQPGDAQPLPRRSSHHRGRRGGDSGFALYVNSYDIKLFISLFKSSIAELGVYGICPLSLMFSVSDVLLEPHIQKSSRIQSEFTLGFLDLGHKRDV